MRKGCAIAFFFIFFLPIVSYSQIIYEISGSPYATDNAPLPSYINPPGEKLILVDPNEHAWGAYTPKGKLIRWGLATAGNDWCPDIKKVCRTHSGTFRIYSVGQSNCISSKFPIPGGGAPMPFCMYFNGSEAIHGADNIDYGNTSHGCIRVHVSDAEWLHNRFVEGPSIRNHYLGTKITVRGYHH